MAGPLFWTEYVDPENKTVTVQAAVIQVDIQTEKALILLSGKKYGGRVTTIPLSEIRWARWD